MIRPELVELDPGEVFHARNQAAARALWHDLNGTYEHVGGQNPHADVIAGATAEIAFAKRRNLWPGLSLGLDGGLDSTTRGGVAVDIKAVHRRFHRLALPLTTRPRADVFVVGAVWPLHVVEFLGWIWQDEALVEARIGRLSERPEHPESYIVPREDLRPMCEAPHLSRADA